MMLEEKGSEMEGRIVLDMVKDERKGAREEECRANRRQLIRRISSDILDRLRDRGAEYVSACQHCCQALFYFARHFLCVTQNDPKWPKTNPK